MFTNQTAIIADDSAQVQRIVARILKQDLNFGHILIAANGRQALEFFEAQQVDWIISDWEMPAMGGHEFVEALRKHPRGGDVPFILMTGHADKSTLTTAMASGVNDFIAKPFSPSTLIQKIRRLATAMERRAAARIAPRGRYLAQIAFAGGAKYPAELVDISDTGCLLRTVPLQQGGTVCDPAKLTLKLESKTVAVNSTTIRIALDNTAEKSVVPTILAAFRFQANTETQDAIKLFIAQQQAKETDQVDEAGDFELIS